MNPINVLHFWFDELEPKQHFIKDKQLDDEIKRRFLSLHEAIIAGETAEWREHLDGRRAEIIVLDQFSRNMFRGEGKAFASDPLALALAQECLRQCDTSSLSAEEYSFIIMPFMHAESMKIQKQALELFDQPGLERSLKFAKAHADIIQKFGRFPHRNKALGRESTPAEIEFMKTHDGF